MHVAFGKQPVNEVPLERLIGDAVVVDVTEQVGRDRDYRVQVKDFQAWEQKHGRIQDGSIVLLRTGFSEYWPDKARYLGTELRGQAGVAALSFPGLHRDAANWLVEERKIKSVGIDTASIDFGKSKTFATHVALMMHNIPAFENVARLEELPAKGFTVIALPAKIGDGSGGPLRIIAAL